jgi:hypothetical protein
VIKSRKNEVCHEESSGVSSLGFSDAGHFDSASWTPTVAEMILVDRSLGYAGFYWCGNERLLRESQLLA